ncbi:MAG: hypothetical protein NT121_15850 [Chloroflexi bacterium]|nr:hypothetical protein [Chloroflexota bacterium]
MTPTPTAVDGAINAGVVLIQQEMYLRLTQQTIDNQRIEAGARATATQQVLDATATQQRYTNDLQATQRAEAATQQAFQVTVAAAQAFDTATAQAQGTATQAARAQQATATQLAVIGLTATIEAKSTAVAEQKTQEAPLIWAKQTAVYAESQKTQIELQKTQATMWVSAWGGWFFALVVLVVAIFVIWKKSQIGVITDENGRVRMIMINQRALQPDLMFGPVLDFSDKNSVTAPALGTSDEFQRQIVHESKVVEAVRALPPGYQRQALGLAGGMAQKPAVNIQVIQPGETGIISQWDADIQGQMAQEVQDD